MSPPNRSLCPVRKCLYCSASQAQCLSVTHPGSQFQPEIDCCTNLAEMNHARDCAQAIALRQLTIKLPDNTLLDIFVYQNEHIEARHPLAHVCQGWRNAVFRSPRRLNLHLLCTAKKPVKEELHVRSDFLIVIAQYDPPTCGADNIFEALVHKERVCEVAFRHISNSLWENVLAAMEVPLPALTRLELAFEGEMMPVVSDSFSGGSAQSPRSFYMARISFPELPRFHSYAADLVNLELHDIPQSGYISPDAMIACLSTLTSLESLCLEFKFPRPRPTIRETGHPPPQTRSVFPFLTYFSFRGVSEYLEDLVARIDAPLLEKLYIIFFHQLTLYTPQLAQFISRTPHLRAHTEARVLFLDDAVQVLLGSSYMQQISIRTSCKAPDWQLWFAAQVCSSSLSLIPSLEHLHICEGNNLRSGWQDDIEDDQWLELLRPFTNVKNLYYLSRGVVPHIAPALQRLVGQGPTEVLPALQGLLLEEPRRLRLVEEPYLWGFGQEAIQKLVASPLLSGHPITVSHCRTH